MIPVFQKVHSVTDGDCFEACLASVLELRLAKVPGFVRDNDPEWWDKVVRWLARQGYAGVWLKNDPPVKPLGYHIAGCDRQQTAIGEIGHAVVAKDGVPVHCPTHGDKPRIPDRIHEWFLLVPFGWPLEFAAQPAAIHLRAIVGLWDSLDAVAPEEPAEKYKERMDALVNAAREAFP